MFSSTYAFYLRDETSIIYVTLNFIAPLCIMHSFCQLNPSPFYLSITSQKKLSRINHPNLSTLTAWLSETSNPTTTFPLRILVLTILLPQKCYSMDELIAPISCILSKNRATVRNSVKTTHWMPIMRMELDACSLRFCFHTFIYIMHICQLYYNLRVEIELKRTI